MASVEENTVHYRLTRQDFGCISSFVTSSPNTSGPERGMWQVKPTGWRPWDDFNYSTLARLLKTELEAEFTGSPAAKPLDMTRTVFNERSLDGYIRGGIIEVVNEALHSVRGKKANHIGDGARLVANNKNNDKKDRVKGAGSPTEKPKAESHLRPDWSMIPYASPKTKVATEERRKNKSSVAQEWEKVLSQVTSYMAENDCRYGFIITDAHLVVLRLSLGDTTAAGQTYANPEYCDIPWGGVDQEISGAGAGLTPKLALFFLCLLASCKGKTHIASKYARLNCWRKSGLLRSFVNSYTDREKKELEAGDEEERLSGDELGISRDDLAEDFEKKLVVKEIPGKKQ